MRAADLVADENQPIDHWLGWVPNAR
jgi:hypothetical protein